MSWIEEALEALQAGQRADGAWSYAGTPAVGDPATEPTALAAMALAAHGRDATVALGWLLAAQRFDGGFSNSPANDETNWATAVAAIALLSAGRTEAGEVAVDWLLGVPVLTMPVIWGSPYGYDTSLPAWPWTPGDYSWVEPTAFAMLALKRSSHAGDDHVAQGRRLLADRYAFDGSSGGWNYGEPQVLGANLSPATVPTAMAVLALRGSDVDLSAATAFLQSRRDSTTSLFSLAWAANAIASVSGLDDAWRAALERAWTDTGGASATRASTRVALNIAPALLAVAEPAGNPLIVG